MTTAAIQIADHIDAAGTVAQYGNTVDWCLSVGLEPTTPNGCLTLYDTGGTGRDTTCPDGGFNNVQVRLRHGDYAVLASKVEAVRDFLDVNSSLVPGIAFLQEVGAPIYIGRDENDLQLVTINYIVRYTENYT